MTKQTKDTEFMQNVLVRLEKEMYIESDASPAVKKKYGKVRCIFVNLITEIDALNDLKEAQKK